MTGKRPFSFTLDEANVDWLDEYVDKEKNPNSEYRNRSHAVDALIADFRKKKEASRGDDGGKTTP